MRHGSPLSAFRERSAAARRTPTQTTPLQRLVRHQTNGTNPNFRIVLCVFVLVAVISPFVLFMYLMDQAMPASPVWGEIGRKYPRDGAAARSIFSLDILDIPSQSVSSPYMRCQNTHRSPHIVADDRGFVCSAVVAKANQGCCATTSPGSKRWRCEGCAMSRERRHGASGTISQRERTADSNRQGETTHPDGNRIIARLNKASQESSLCCDRFEICVSCCLKQESTRVARRVAGEQTPRQETDFPNGVSFCQDIRNDRDGSSFQWCSCRCRTHSGHTEHENAYASPLHFCFDIDGAAP